MPAIPAESVIIEFSLQESSALCPSNSHKREDGLTSNTFPPHHSSLLPSDPPSYCSASHGAPAMAIGRMQVDAFAGGLVISY
jgi:hypothetical protein